MPNSALCLLPLVSCLSLSLSLTFSFFLSDYLPPSPFPALPSSPLPFPPRPSSPSLLFSSIQLPYYDCAEAHKIPSDSGFPTRILGEDDRIGNPGLVHADWPSSPALPRLGGD